MTKHKKMGVGAAIDLLKSGGSLEEVIVTGVETAKVHAMDALLLAKNGCVVPDGNIVYDDNRIEYDPDFDEVTWGKFVPFSQLKESLAEETDEPASEVAELVVKLKIQNLDMKRWLTENKTQLDMVIRGLIENMYKAEQLPKA